MTKKQEYDAARYRANAAEVRERTRLFRLTPAGKKQKAESSARSRAKLRTLSANAKNVPCADCGRRYPSYVMDFDHLGNKKIEVARMVGGDYSERAVLAEIAKCEVVCANCHRERTYGKRLHAVS